MRLRPIVLASLAIVGCSREDRTSRDDHQQPSQPSQPSPAQQQPQPPPAESAESIAPQAEPLPPPLAPEPAAPAATVPKPATPPPPPTIAYPTYDEPAVVAVAEPVVGEPVANVDVFFDQLEPYGTWYDDPTYGWSFAPDQTGYVPYSNGYWKSTTYGLTWVSYDAFGWATSHYGRWLFRNRWIWIPDTTWGPAWVTWRQADGVVGWAPCGYAVDAYVPEPAWRFVTATVLFSIDIRRHYVTRDIHGYLDRSAPIARYHRHDGSYW